MLFYYKNIHINEIFNIGNYSEFFSDSRDCECTVENKLNTYLNLAQRFTLKSLVFI